MKKTTQVKKVVAVRARQASEGKKKLYFLFATSQVEEVLTDIVVRPLPFAPAFLQGVTCWRKCLLPVVDLEKRFAIDDEGKKGTSRFVVVRAGTMEGSAEGEVVRCVLKLSDEIHSKDISASRFVIENEGIDVHSSLVRGTYRLNDDMYIVPDLVSILQNQSDAKS